MFNQFGDLERCALRSGQRPQRPWLARRLWSRSSPAIGTSDCGASSEGDAAFALPDVYEFLEAEGFGYAIRLPANTILQGNIAHLLKRPVGQATERGATLLRELQLPGRQLEQGPPGRRQGRMASR